MAIKLYECRKMLQMVTCSYLYVCIKFKGQVTFHYGPPQRSQLRDVTKHTAMHMHVFLIFKKTS